MSIFKSIRKQGEELSGYCQNCGEHFEEHDPDEAGYKHCS